MCCPWPSLPFRPPFLNTLCPVPLRLPNMEQITQQHGQLDAAPQCWALVLVLTAAVLLTQTEEAGAQDGLGSHD